VIEPTAIAKVLGIGRSGVYRVLGARARTGAAAGHVSGSDLAAKRRRGRYCHSSLRGFSFVVWHQRFMPGKTVIPSPFQNPCGGQWCFQILEVTAGEFAHRVFAFAILVGHIIP
jgi:hypothetical protein